MLEADAKELVFGSDRPYKMCMECTECLEVDRRVGQTKVAKCPSCGGEAVYHVKSEDFITEIVLTVRK